MIKLTDGLLRDIELAEEIFDYLELEEYAARWRETGNGKQIESNRTQ